MTRDWSEEEETATADHDVDEDEKKSRKCPVVCGGHERTLSIQDTVNLLDVKEEGIATLLSYIENHCQKDFLENLGVVYSTCRMQCYLGQGQLLSLASKHPPVALAMAQKKSGTASSTSGGDTSSAANELVFNVIDVCDALGLRSGAVKKELKALQWTSTSTGWKKTGVMVDFRDLAFHLRVRGDLTADQLDDVIDFLWAKVRRRERDQVRFLAMLSDALKSVSYKSYWMCSDEMDQARSDRLKVLLTDYFQKDHLEEKEEEAEDEQDALAEEPDPSALHQLRLDIGQFVALYGQSHQWTARAVARVLHGIPSPCFPADVWGRVRRYWRSHLDVGFNVVMREAQQVLLAYR